jgi:hypothetical protein
MADLTKQKRRELNLWVAKAAGIPVLTDIPCAPDGLWIYDCLGALWLRKGKTDSRGLWHPDVSFDQAIEHLGPALDAKGIYVYVTYEPGDLPIVEMIDDKPGGIQAREVCDCTATAYCLAAKAALMGDSDGHS